MKFCASLAFTDPTDYCELAVLAVRLLVLGLGDHRDEVLPRLRTAFAQQFEDVPPRLPHPFDPLGGR